MIIQTSAYDRKRDKIKKYGKVQMVINLYYDYLHLKSVQVYNKKKAFCYFKFQIYIVNIHKFYSIGSKKKKKRHINTLSNI